MTDGIDTDEPKRKRKRVKWADYRPSNLDQAAIDWTRQNIKRMGLKNKHVAHHLGVSEQRFSNKMCGKNRLNIIELRKLAAFFGVPPPNFVKEPQTADVSRVRIIGRIVEQPAREETAMTPNEMKRARAALELTLDQMAEMLGYEGTQRRQQQYDLETGKRPIRGCQRRLIEAYLAGWRPEDWPR
jgi:transcriptional regulator with XRE-family HTH domain